MEVDEAQQEGIKEDDLKNISDKHASLLQPVASSSILSFVSVLERIVRPPTTAPNSPVMDTISFQKLQRYKQLTQIKPSLRN